MLRFFFSGGFADVKFGDIPKCIYQNGFCCKARWRGKDYSAYIVLNRKGWFEPSYIDLDNEFDINVLHASLTDVEVVAPAEAFTKAFCRDGEVQDEEIALENFKKELFLLQMI